MNTAKIQCITPDWPAPANVGAVVSTRRAGGSTGFYRYANLANHVGDQVAAVQHNRALLVAQTRASRWQWLQQVHGARIVEATHITSGRAVEADASFTRHPALACAVLTADCLPVLLCDTAGTQVAAVHAGWRGLCAGILTGAVQTFVSPTNVLAYLGPAISRAHFEVGEDVYRAFAAHAGSDASQHGAKGWQQYFVAVPDRPGHYMADLYGLARFCLGRLGVEKVYGGEHCTYREAADFYSYRREGTTGRMVSAIWLM